MEFSLVTMAFLILNFFLVVFLLRRFLYGPLSKVIDERQSQIVSDIEKAKADRDESRRLREIHESEIEKLRRDVEEAINHAVLQGQREKKEILVEAREEAAEILQRASRQVEAERLQAWDELRNEAVDLSIEIASRFVVSSEDPDLHRQRFQELLYAIQSGEKGGSQAG